MFGGHRPLKNILLLTSTSFHAHLFLLLRLIYSRFAIGSDVDHTHSSPPSSQAKHQLFGSTITPSSDWRGTPSWVGTRAEPPPPTPSVPIIASAPLMRGEKPPPPPSSSSAKEKESPQRDTAVFDTRYVELIEEELRRELAGAAAAEDDQFRGGRRRRLTALAQLGKLALYARLQKRWLETPRRSVHVGPSGGKRRRRYVRGYARAFPLIERFHPDLYDACTGGRGAQRVDLMKCIGDAYKEVRERAAVLFPRDESRYLFFVTRESLVRRVREEFELEEELFRRSVNADIDYDVSVSQLFCFLTKRRLSFMRRLPFCAYGADVSPLQQEHIWPSARFRKVIFLGYRDNRDEAGRVVRVSNYEAIDTLAEQRDFECADQSFCPDPCCGRTLGRATAATPFEAACTNARACTEEPGSADALGGRHLREHPCYLVEAENANFDAMVANVWNRTCACIHADSGNKLRQPGRVDTTHYFEPRLKFCRDINECAANTSRLCTREYEVCENRIGGYACVCALGYMRDNRTNSSASASALEPSGFNVANCIRIPEAEGESILP